MIAEVQLERFVSKLTYPMNNQPKSDSDISLLNGFDAMLIFLNAWWERHDKRSDDLANLLSNISRDAWANGQPLDIAQWSDWLDAVLLVRPDLGDVRATRREIIEEHRAFLEAREIVSPSERQKALDELRAARKNRTWHRIGYRSMTVLDAYEAMRAFLSAYWNRGGKPEDIGAIVSALGDAFSPRMWDAWIIAVQEAKVGADRLN